MAKLARLSSHSKMPAYALLAAQILAHLSIIPMLYFGKPGDYLISLTVYFFTGCLGMNITYHRLLSHRSWRPPRFFEEIGTLLGTIGLTGSSIAWTAIHREHHAYSDKPNDPHSPHHQKWWRVQFLSMFHPPRVKSVRDLMRSSFHRFVHRNYFKINIAYALICLTIDPFLIISAYLFPAAVLWNAGSMINSIGHLFGYKNFPLADESRNNLFLGFFVWGEGWHNNHHRFPNRAYYGVRWYEFDVSGAVIKLLERPVRRAPDKLSGLKN